MFTILRRSLLLAIVLAPCTATASDWPRFHGPKGLGVSGDRGVPEEWGTGKNMVWKTKLPGAAASSPIVWGDRIFLTCYTGYGLGKGGDIKELSRRLMCFDRKTGALRWEQIVPARLPEAKFSHYINEHGYASSTPVTDGQRVYAFFGRSGVLACDLDGKQLWHVEVGKWLNGWGSAASPVLYRDLVIVNATVERAAIVALDAKTGKEVWRSQAAARFVVHAGHRRPARRQGRTGRHHQRRADRHRSRPRRRVVALRGPGVRQRHLVTGGA